MTLRSPVVGPDEQVVPKEPSKAQLDQGEYVNSEWLNDNAPIGQAMYRAPAEAVYKATLSAAPAPQYVEVTEEEIKAVLKRELTALEGYPTKIEGYDEAARAILQFLSTKLTKKDSGKTGEDLLRDGAKAFQDLLLTLKDDRRMDVVFQVLQDRVGTADQQINAALKARQRGEG